MQLEISKSCLSHIFHCSPSKRYENIVYHGNSKCLLEYCNQKLASSTQDNVFYLKHSCVLGLQFKQSVKASGPLIFHGIGTFVQQVQRFLE